MIDGLQRISTIVKFLDEDEKWKLSKVEDIDPKISGKFVSDLRNGSPNLRKYYDRVENISIPVTILRCDMSKSAHSEYVFTIFHRLNTGGTKLNNQEIRSCIFNGAFNDLLRRLDSNENWQTLNKMSPDQHYRFTKQELILRVFAFEEDLKNYGGKLSKFLNDYMRKYRHSDGAFINAKEVMFNEVVDLALNKMWGGTAPRKINISIFEAALVGIALNLEYLRNANPDDVVKSYKKLIASEPFSSEKLKEGLSAKVRVIERMETAKTIFGPNG